MRLSILVAALCVACATDNEPIVELGFIQGISDPPRIQTPTTVKVGERFQVVVATYGYLHCMSKHSTEVAVGPDIADVWPYDQQRIPEAGGGCIAKLCAFHHEADIQFDTPGEKTLRVTGRHRFHDPSEPNGQTGEEVIEVWRLISVVE